MVVGVFSIFPFFFFFCRRSIGGNQCHFIIHTTWHWELAYTLFAQTLSLSLDVFLHNDCVHPQLALPAVFIWIEQKTKTNSWKKGGRGVMAEKAEIVWILTAISHFALASVTPSSSSFFYTNTLQLYSGGTGGGGCGGRPIWELGKQIESWLFKLLLLLLLIY